MRDPEIDQADGDVFAYIASLDAAEALGELQHLGVLYARAAAPHMAAGTRGPDTLALVLMPICVALAQQIETGDGGLVPTPHEPGTFHTCQLISRSITAR